MRSSRPPRPRPRESVIQRQAMQLLRSYHWLVFRRNTGATRATHKGKTRFVRFSEPGMSDLWCLMAGPTTAVHVEIEIKRPGERPTPDQVRWLLLMTLHGVPAFWVDNLPTLDRIAQHLMRGGRIGYLDSLNGDFDLIEPRRDAAC